MAATRKVKVIRAFYFGGKIQEEKSTPTLPTAFALEMHASGKVELLPIVKDEEPTPGAPAAQGKGGKNAG